MKDTYQILIIGGGTAGIMTAAQLKKKDKQLDIAIIEPNDTHWYQPAWTLVGAGTYKMSKTRDKEEKYIPDGVDWIKDYATAVDPDNNMVSTMEKGEYNYDYLIVAPGLVMDMGKIEGLEEALDTPYVCSNYTDPEHTWEVLQNFEGGNALFTQPDTPIKCGGAPQKIMYLADEYLRKQNVREKSNVIFATPGSVIFGVEPFKQELERIVEEKEIDFKPFYAPRKINSEEKWVEFEYKSDDLSEETMDDRLKEKVVAEKTIRMPFDMLHLAPPQKAPDFVSNSKLAVQEGPNKGWVEVDINTLQHKRYANVFSLGDVAALPTAKTGAAIRKQAPVVVENLLHIMAQEKADQEYEGYSSCPLVTGYGKMLLAEFKYNNERDSDPFLSKFVDTSKEKWSMWILKKYGLPFMYWNFMLKGRM
jgi:sulfide:quinone oxidoreductase